MLILWLVESSIVLIHSKVSSSASWSSLFIFGSEGVWFLFRLVKYIGFDILDRVVQKYWCMMYFFKIPDYLSTDKTWPMFNYYYYQRADVCGNLIYIEKYSTHNKINA